MKPEQLRAAALREIEGAQAVKAVDEAVFIGEAAGRLDVKGKILPDRHFRGDGFFIGCAVGVVGFQVEGVHVARAKAHGTADAGLGFGGDQTGLFKHADMLGGG